jgi:hypothetical protein
MIVVQTIFGNSIISSLGNLVIHAHEIDIRQFSNPMHHLLLSKTRPGCVELNSQPKSSEPLIAYCAIQRGLFIFLCPHDSKDFSNVAVCFSQIEKFNHLIPSVSPSFFFSSSDSSSVNHTPVVAFSKLTKC